MDPVAQAHIQDLQVQNKYDVRYLSYWFDYARQHAFCLVKAPGVPPVGLANPPARHSPRGDRDDRPGNQGVAVAGSLSSKMLPSLSLNQAALP